MELGLWFSGSETFADNGRRIGDEETGVLSGLRVSDGGFRPGLGSGTNVFADGDKREGDEVKGDLSRRSFGSGMNAFADGDKHDEDETLCDGDSLSGGGFGLGLGSSTHSVDDDAAAHSVGDGAAADGSLSGAETDDSLSGGGFVAATAGISTSASCNSLELDDGGCSAMEL